MRASQLWLRRSSAGQSGSDVVLSLAPGSEITIRNLQLAQLDLGDFVF